jgi:hypothetical protein
LRLLSALFNTNNSIRSAAKVSTFLIRLSTHIFFKYLLNFLFFIWLQIQIGGFPVGSRAVYLWASIRNTEIEEHLRQKATLLLSEIISENFDDFYSNVCIPLINCLSHISLVMWLNCFRRSWVYPCSNRKQPKRIFYIYEICKTFLDGKKGEIFPKR